KRMPGSVYSLYDIITYFKFLSVFSYGNLKLGSSGWPVYYVCPCLFSQVQVARYKVGMKMRFKNVFYFSIVFYCPVNIGLNFPKKVKNGCIVVTFKLVSCLSHTTCIFLFYLHNQNLCITNNCCKHKANGKKGVLVIC